MKLSSKLLKDLEFQIKTLKGAFPEKDSPLGQDIDTMARTLCKCQLAIREGN